MKRRRKYRRTLPQTDVVWYGVNLTQSTGRWDPEGEVSQG